MKTLRTLVLGITASTLVGTATIAADFSTPYVAPLSTGFGFEGFYAGVLLGGILDGGSSYLTAPDTVALNAGLAVGVNFYLTDSVLGGLEVQGSAEFGATATRYDGLILGKLGFAPTPDFMAYGTGGIGLAGNSTVYAFGAGAEVALADSMSVRGEILGLGPFGAAPDAAKATVGLLWHMQ